MATHTDTVKAFTKALYTSDLKESLPPKKDFYKFMKVFLADFTTDKSTDDELLRLKSEYTEVLGKPPKGPKANDKDWLKNKISESSSGSDTDTELDDLKLKYFNELGRKPSGPKANNAEWLRNKITESKKPKSEVQLLKEEYTEKLGKKPSGPKANNIEWLKTKISDFESHSQEETELKEMKAKYEEVLGKKPKGPKANDMDWLKNKIDEVLKADESEEEGDEAKDESSDEEIEDSSDEEQYKFLEEMEEESIIMIQAFARGFLHRKSSKALKFASIPPPHPDGIEAKKRREARLKKLEEDDSDSGKGTGLKPLKLELKEPTDFRFEGVAYKRTFDEEKKVWMVEDDDGNGVGEWMEDKTGGWIIWEEDCWEEIHQEHKDYTGEA